MSTKRGVIEETNGGRGGSMSAKRGDNDETAASRGAFSSTGPYVGVEHKDAVSVIETESSPSAVEAAAELVDVEISDASASNTAVHAIFTKASEIMLNLERLTASYQECDY